MSIYRHRTEIKCHFWKPGIELFRRHSVFIRKDQIENLTLCDPRLTWPFADVDVNGSDCKMASVFELHVEIGIIDVLHAQNSFFLFWWSFVTYRDFSWPDLDPYPFLVWHLCWKSIFTSPLRLLWLSFEQKLSILRP